MSASREKKSRQSDPTQGLTQKERKELQEQQAAKRKAVVYTVIGVIVAVLVAAAKAAGLDPARIAVVGIGYADGFPRSLSSNVSFLLHGRRVPQLLRHRCQLLFHLLYESGIQHQRRRF